MRLHDVQFTYFMGIVYILHVMKLKVYTTVITVFVAFGSINPDRPRQVGIAFDPIPPIPSSQNTIHFDTPDTGNKHAVLTRVQFFTVTIA